MPRHRTAPKEITMRDVAARSGVSVMTVSNVVNGRIDQMRSDTRVRVEHAIQALNYRPHQVARNLRRSERLSIGVLFIDDADPAFLAHPGHSYVIAGLSSYLNERGYSLKLQGIAPSQIHSAISVKQIDTDALCVVQSGIPSRRRQIIERLADLGQPCALIHETNAPNGLDVCCIREDDLRGGRLIARHLVERGCRDILLVLPETIWASMEERARGIMLECRKRNVGTSIVRCTSARLEDTHAALENYFCKNRVPDGIAAGNDQIGIGALKFLKEQRLTVPDQVRVTGFNAFEFWKYSGPLLTTIRAPATALGSRAGEELIRRLTIGEFSSRRIVLPVELVTGDST